MIAISGLKDSTLRPMTRDFALPRLVLIYFISIPLALFLGYLMATPLNLSSLGVVSFCLLILAFPVFLRQHHAMLVCACHASLILYFLPGQPPLWVVLALGNIAFAVVNRAMKKQVRYLHVPMVSWALVFLTFVVTLTAFMTGGIGARVLGSDTFGGSRYFSTYAAIVGYFGLVTQPIAKGRGPLLASLFFLGGITAVASDVVYAAGPRFYFLFAFFPTQLAYLQAITQDAFVRSTGLTWAALSVFYFVLLRFGIRGSMDFGKPWRLLLFIGSLVAAFYGGYRSSVLLMGFVFVVQFFFEGLHKTVILPAMVVATLIGGPIFIANLDRMPLTIQRSFSFLPVQVDPQAKADAAATVDWRVTMWRIMLPEVPKYLLLGRGYSFSGSEFYLTQEAVKNGIYFGYEEALVTGDYHNGLLTLIIPFGIWGTLAFLWLGGAGFWVLWRNWQHGDPSLRQVNTFLLSYFTARYIFYFAAYGKFDQDLFVFTGVLGLGIALNGGVRKANDGWMPPPVAEAEEEEA